MLVVNLLVVNRSSRKVSFVKKELDFGVKKNWGFVWKFKNMDNVLWGSVFDDVRLGLWEWERGKEFCRIDV